MIFFKNYASANYNKLIYDFKINSITGEIINFSEYQNKAILLVNVASYCGFTKQYADLQKLWESQSIQITLPLFIAITALSRFIILQGKSINPEILVYEAGAILLIALAILVLRFRNSPIVGLDKKKKASKK